MEANQVLGELAAIYGMRFMRQYDGMDMEQVARAWSRQLATLTPRAIEWAMEHLPNVPLNALEFRALAMQRPAVQHVQEQGPPADPARVGQIMACLSKGKGRGAWQWAMDLQARELAGEKLTQAQRVMWRVVIER